MTRSTSLTVPALLCALVGCGGGAAAPPPTTPTAAEAAEEGQVARVTNGSGDLVLFPGVSLVLPTRGASSAMLRVATEVEEVVVERREAEADAVTTLEGMQRSSGALAGERGVVRPLELAGHQGHMLTVFTTDHGPPRGLAFAVADVDDGEQVVLSYQHFGAGDAAATLERLSASLRTSPPSEAPPEGSQHVGIAGLYLTVPARFLLGNASCLLQPEGELRVSLEGIPSGPDDDHLAQLTTEQPGQARRISGIERREVIVGGRAGQLTSYRVRVGEDDDEGFAETFAVLPATSSARLVVHGRRLPEELSLDDVLATTRWLRAERAAL